MNDRDIDRTWRRLEAGAYVLLAIATITIIATAVTLILRGSS